MGGFVRGECTAAMQMSVTADGALTLYAVVAVPGPNGLAISRLPILTSSFVWEKQHEAWFLMQSHVGRAKRAIPPNSKLGAIRIFDFIVDYYSA